MMSASIMEEEPPDYLYNLGLVQQNSTDSCHPAITLSVKMVDEGPQRDSFPFYPLLLTSQL
ncbi:hypothetical protein T03_904 [Trichinella britovi]|uniref:Uncharacterized protein n=1 Tax=Trichinella britovi TaxID=45882 RepID=A0A0V1C4P9_TRIBR|nr:hypothetical protein T03_904 [Trichinella britovi]